MCRIIWITLKRIYRLCCVKENGISTEYLWERIVFHILFTIFKKTWLADGIENYMKVESRTNSSVLMFCSFFTRLILYVTVWVMTCKSNCAHQISVQLNCYVERNYITEIVTKNVASNELFSIELHPSSLHVWRQKFPDCRINDWYIRNQYWEEWVYSAYSNFEVKICLNWYETWIHH